MPFARILRVPVLVALVALPWAASASSVWHPGPGESGVTYHPDHVKATMTRAQVMAEVEIARRDGTLALIQRGQPLPMTAGQAQKSRQQVIEELLNESPSERRARLASYLGG